MDYLVRDHSFTAFQIQGNFRNMYVQNNLVFVSHKNINSEIAVSQIVYCLTRKDNNDRPGIENCFNIVFLKSAVMKWNLLCLTNIILFVLLNLQTNQSFSIRLTFVL